MPENYESSVAVQVREALRLTDVQGSVRPRDYLSLMRLVQSHGDEVANATRCSPRPIIICAALSKAEYVGLLLARGADPEVTDSSGRTPLILAAETGCTAAVRLLLAHGANVTAVDGRRQTALHVSARRGRLETVRILLREAGASPNGPRSIIGYTPLLYAASTGSLPLVQLLVAYGASISAVNSDGDSAVDIAGRHGHYQISNWLLEQDKRRTTVGET
jgi:ankyrin repeat domain-containing protein 50